MHNNNDLLYSYHESLSVKLHYIEGYHILYTVQIEFYKAYDSHFSIVTKKSHSVEIQI